MDLVWTEKYNHNHHNKCEQSKQGSGTCLTVNLKIVILLKAQIVSNFPLFVKAITVFVYAGKAERTPPNGNANFFCDKD